MLPQPNNATAPSGAASLSPLLTSSLDNADLSKLGPILKKIKGNPEVAYLLGQLKKGLTKGGVFGEDRASLVRAIKAALLRSPTILEAVRQYRG
jgi:hypothetical protein